MSNPTACYMWPDCRCMAGPCPNLPPPAAAPAPYTPILTREETIARLSGWAAEMLASTPPRTGALHLLDAVHYLRHPLPPKEAEHA